MEENKLQVMSKQLSDALDRLEQIADPEQYEGKNQKQVDHLKFRTAKIIEQNNIEEQEVRALVAKIQKMELLKQCVIREENNLRKSAAMKEQTKVEEHGGYVCEPDIVKQKRKDQYLNEIVDPECKQAINQYDRRNRLLMMMSKPNNFDTHVGIDPSCYEKFVPSSSVTNQSAAMDISRPIFL